ncbi:MAG: MipA/OmpV family protein [Casimicrobiaceae bacterium]
MTLLSARSFVASVACAFALGMNGLALADEHPEWDLQFGAGVATLPEYSGASASSARLRVWADGSYRTANLGTFSIDSGSLTIDPELRWDFVDRRDLGFGVLLGYRSGRGDSKPSFGSANNGSARLIGLPNISGAVDVGVVGHVAVFNVPLFAQIRSAVSGPQGTLVNIGVYLPLPLNAAFELTVLPTLTWANGREMRAFYGVTAEQSATSEFAAYNPSAGWENAALEVAGDWKIGSGWHLLASVAYQRLLSNAAASPLVQTRNQPSAFAGVAWNF